MLVPKHFRQHDRGQLLGLMAAYPFATLVAQNASGVEAHHLPLLVDETDDRLHVFGHVARANPLTELGNAIPAVAIFHGPHGYVSPSAYPSKAVHGKAVPTWNYVAVHARGTLRLVHDRDRKRQINERLTAHFEASQRQPWSMDEAPPDYIDRLLDAIVGIELTVTALDGQWKLSQNKSDADRQGVIDAFEQAEPDAAIAQAMRTSSRPETHNQYGQA